MDSLVSSPYWPFVVLISSIIVVVSLISHYKFHPFIALMLAAIFVGLISDELPSLENFSRIVRAVEVPMIEFGIVAGKISWVIALAAIIGAAMMESGAAERIVNSLLSFLGEKRAPLALLISGFILSIPVFFDTVFFLLIPLAITMALKTGKNYILYVIAIAGGAVITHTLVPPTPGPLIMSETFQIELGVTILTGILMGIIPATVILYLAKRMNEKFNIPVRIRTSHALESKPSPGLLMCVLPIVSPIILISSASIVQALYGTLPAWLAFWGNKNIAMGLGTAIALLLWAKTLNLSSSELWKRIVKPLEIAGIIILITSGGGAYGAMIKHSGIGEAIKITTANFQVHYLFLAWIIAAVMKTAQGSGTVAMITTSSIMVALIGTSIDLPYHPIYVLMAIGFGSCFISWMNDSGFWVVAKMSGLTEKETLQTWTLILASFAVVGLILVLIVSTILPFR
ncbi:MAG: gluconate transporter [Candidatus Marinimicrobia bacterium]|nr:gluconate transporter [Candidatus Neomarinimicrobiota bacterium]